MKTLRLPLTFLTTSVALAAGIVLLLATIATRPASFEPGELPLAEEGMPEP